MMWNGVHLETRIPNGDCTHLTHLVDAIGTAYEVPADRVLSRLYVDDKNCALYEADMAEDIPAEWAYFLARELVVIFRKLGGYNGLVFRHHSRELFSEDPWWDEPRMLAANDP